MANPFDPELMNQLMARKTAEWDAQDKAKASVQPMPESSPTPVETLSPKLAMLVGQGLDSASTYAFLKQGQHEANPALQYMNNSANSVIPSALAGGLGYTLLYNMLHKNHPKIADTAAGLLGGFHMALGGHNLEPQTHNSYDAVLRDFKQLNSRSR